MEIIIKRRQHLKLPVLVRCRQLCLSSNQIAGFLVQQYLWKKLIDILDFLCEDIHEEKVACEITIFSWVNRSESRIQYPQKNSSILKSPKTSLYTF